MLAIRTSTLAFGEPPDVETTCPALPASRYRSAVIPLHFRRAGPGQGYRRAKDAGTELIPRDALFGNPERSSVLISPDGKTLSWLAPVDGVMNVWIAPAANPSKARVVTGDKARGIRNYFWSYQPDTLLYLREAAATRTSILTAWIETPHARRDRFIKEVRDSLTERELEALAQFFKPGFDAGPWPGASKPEKGDSQ
jgi:hypothetical protein